MGIIEIVYGTPTKIIHTIDNLVQNNKEFLEISDALYMLKNKATDSDEAALVTKNFKTSNGIEISQIEKTITVTLVKDDFGTGKLQTGDSYLICFSVEFNDDGNYIEDVDPGLKRKLRILPDKTRR